MKLSKEDLLPLLQDLKSWLSNENIVGLDVARKRKSGKETDEWAVVAYVIKKKQLHQLTDADLKLPSEVLLHLYSEEGKLSTVMVPTDVVESGEIKLQSNNERIRPCPGGMQIMAGTFGWSGTLGANVVWGGKLRLLSNNHVLSNNGEQENAFLYQPTNDTDLNKIGNVDGYIPVQTYTNRHEAHPVYNQQDIAWCDISTGNADLDIVGIGKIKGLRTPKVGQRVRVIGAASGVVRTTTISSLTGRMVTEFDKGKWAWFENVIVLESAVTIEGDSGAAYVDDDNYIVGLHMAGNDLASYGFLL